MGDVDIIISCTSAPHFVVHKKNLFAITKCSLLCMLDLAVPRDIEPSVHEIKGVELYRIDDLEKIANKNIEKRLKAKENSLEILNNDVDKFIDWLDQSRVIGMIFEIQDS